MGNRRVTDDETKQSPSNTRLTTPSPFYFLTVGSIDGEEINLLSNAVRNITNLIEFEMKKQLSKDEN